MDDQPIKSSNSGLQKRGLVAPLDLTRSLAALGRLERGLPASPSLAVWNSRNRRGTADMI
jgi:hypothetical protein